ncbi:uncharacterized protein LOC110036811 [Phalaenopsis equestris]|uniref:uncharacterized protein LOC110036811 n=1 Tax=Phalaenopsis equestris TaxID=78828 RepID=UPI0009E2F8A1|nr:uncharacterized protein LOC110036811 [Phalaenopsis equestris]
MILAATPPPRTPAATPPPRIAGFGLSPATFEDTKFVSFSNSKWKKRGNPFRISCVPKDGDKGHLEGFSLLSKDFPWEVESTWSTFAVYFFSLHVPLSFGILPMIARALQQSFHDPLLTAVSALTLQGTELTGFLSLLYYTANNRNKLPSFFLGTSYPVQRNWLKVSASGIGFLILLVLLTSRIADEIIEPKGFNNPILKEILLYSPISKTTCFILYCFVTPLLEEIVYRGFLLTSIASQGKLWQAICISSLAFSLAHFSLENFLQLFIIGYVLGSVYSWSGKLVASVTVHSVYNFIILIFVSVS